MIGVIPCIVGDPSSRPYTAPVELLPAGLEELDGKTYIKTVLDYIVESMVVAGAEILVMVINRKKMDIPERYGNGKGIGVPVVYTWQPDKQGIAAAIDTAYPIMPEIALATVPGLITPPDTLKLIKESLLESDADLVVSRSKKNLHFPLYCWRKPFADLLREHVTERAVPTMQDAIGIAQKTLNVVSATLESVHPVYTDWTKLYSNMFKLPDQGST